MTMVVMSASTPNGLHGCRCEKCGAYFAAKTPTARYCSDACRNLSNY